LGSCGVGNVPMESLPDLGGLVDRSLRHLGQILVVMGALLGAVLGVGLALIVENADISRAVVAPGRERAAVLAADPPSSRPPVSRGAGSADSAAGNDISGSQRAEAADQADQGDGETDKKNKRHDKPGKGEDKAGKDKGK
jgi:hypothetical protein